VATAALEPGPGTTADNKQPSLILETGQKSVATAPNITMELLNRVWRGQAMIGAADPHGYSGLYGDIGEVLIYDHAFLAHDPIQNVKEYLLDKWSIVEDTTTDWTLVAPSRHRHRASPRRTAFGPQTPAAGGPGRR